MSRELPAGQKVAVFLAGNYHPLESFSMSREVERGELPPILAMAKGYADAREALLPRTSHILSPKRLAREHKRIAAIRRDPQAAFGDELYTPLYYAFNELPLGSLVLLPEWQSPITAAFIAGRDVYDSRRRVQQGTRTVMEAEDIVRYRQELYNHANVSISRIADSAPFIAHQLGRPDVTAGLGHTPINLAAGMTGKLESLGVAVRQVYLTPGEEVPVSSPRTELVKSLISNPRKIIPDDTIVDAYEAERSIFWRYGKAYALDMILRDVTGGSIIYREPEVRNAKMYEIHRKAYDEWMRLQARRAWGE